MNRIIALAIFAAATGPACTQSFERLVEVEKKVAALEERVSALEGKKSAPTSSATVGTTCYTDAYGRTVCTPMRSSATYSTVSYSAPVVSYGYAGNGNKVRFNGDGSTTEIETEIQYIRRPGPLARFFGVGY